MGEAALIGALFTIVTILLVYRTFEEQRAANAHARRQFLHAREDALATARAATETLAATNKIADAASEQVKIAQEAAYRQLRAYISIEKPKVTSVTKTAIVGKLTIRNAGQTPAAIKLYLATRIEKYPSLEIPEGAPAPLLFSFHGPYINAHSSEIVTWFYQLESLKPTQDGPAEIARVIAEPVDFALYLYGRIEFMDYKRHRRVLKFAFRNEGGLTLGDAGDRMIATPWGSDYEDLDKEGA